MIKKYMIVCSALAFLFIEYRYSMRASDIYKNEKLPVKVMPFRTGIGWGYEIDVDGKTFIRQDCMPAIPGRRGFSSPDVALKVGQLLIQKMKNNKRPVITVDELKGMKIRNL